MNIFKATVDISIKKYENNSFPHKFNVKFIFISLKLQKGALIAILKILRRMSILESENTLKIY